MGVDFIVKTQDFVTKTLNLQIFDTSGQERYDSFIKGSHFVIFVYDITSNENKFLILKIVQTIIHLKILMYGLKE